VGQDEVDVVRTADVSVVLQVPGGGDDVQAIKAGIMEIADIFVVNKADREGADHVVQAITANLSLQTFAPADWRPPIVKTDAITGAGVATLWAEIGRFRAQSNDRRTARHRARQEGRLRDLVAHRFLQHVEATLPAGEFEALVDRIARRETDPYTAASDVLNAVLPSAGKGPSAGARQRP
jgi:LAO/AO transport system kinase